MLHIKRITMARKNFMTSTVYVASEKFTASVKAILPFVKKIPTKVKIRSDRFLIKHSSQGSEAFVITKK